MLYAILYGKKGKGKKEEEIILEVRPLPFRSEFISEADNSLSTIGFTPISTTIPVLDTKNKLKKRLVTVKMEVK